MQYPPSNPIYQSLDELQEVQENDLMQSLPNQPDSQDKEIEKVILHVFLQRQSYFTKHLQHLAIS